MESVPEGCRFFLWDLVKAHLLLINICLSVSASAVDLSCSRDYHTDLTAHLCCLHSVCTMI